MKSNFYYMEYRDRSDPDPLAVFFMVYNRTTGEAVWESATYYNDKEMERVAERIVGEFDKNPTYGWNR